MGLAFEGGRAGHDRRRRSGQTDRRAKRSALPSRSRRFRVSIFRGSGPSCQNRCDEASAGIRHGPAREGGGSRTARLPLESMPLDLAEPQSLDPGDVVEAKARDAYGRLSRPVVVEDSGLEIHAWRAFSGSTRQVAREIGRSRGAGAHARSIRQTQRDCDLRRGLYRRGAIDLGPRRGARVQSPRRHKGSGGFGWDSVFVPDGSALTFAQMSGEEKDRVSHRRRAWEVARLEAS